MQNQALHQEVYANKNVLFFTGSLAVLLLIGTILFGAKVLLIALATIALAAAIEGLFYRLRKQQFGKVWFVTPLIVTLLMPPTIPLWIALVATGFGVFFGKSIFGGEGKNIFNPAIVGILFVTISFLGPMTTSWMNPTDGSIVVATPMVELLGSGAFNHTIWDLLLGQTVGAIGTTFRLAILILGIVLSVLKVIDWKIPVAYLGTVLILALLGSWISPDKFREPILSLFVGSLLFGAFFVATEPVSAPGKPVGRLVYGIGLGILTVVIRYYSAFPEGLIFAIILMNAISPLIDQWRSEKTEVKEEASV